MTIDALTQYIRPELGVVVVVLYFMGMALKKFEYIKDEFIPVILGIVSIVLCGIYILAVSETPTGYQEVLILIFNTIIQGICCAAASVYVNQVYKQSKKTS